MQSVLVAGEINVDLLLVGYTTFPQSGREVLVDDFQMALGSASAICAMGLARLGTPVRFVGNVGSDIWGEYCVDVMRLRGIDMGPVKVDAALKTGVTVSISNASDRALVTFLGAITSLTGADIGDDLLAGVNHLHVSSYFLQQGLRADCRDLFRRASQRGITTSLDPGFDPAESWGSDLMDVLEFTDVFLPNEVELEAITKQREPAEALRSLENGRTAVVAKLGSRGAMSIDKGELVAVPAYHAGVLDTTGAGDSFNAGFLNAWLRGEPLLSAIRLGCACGALSTEGVGGTGGQPTLEQALRRMGSDDAAGQSASRA